MIQKIRKIVSELCVTAILISSVFSTSVFADYKQVGVNGIRLYGNTQCRESGHIVCVDVWAHEKGAEDLLSAPSRDDFSDIIALREEIESGEDGAYEIAFEMGDRASGLYDAYIACTCGEEIIEETIVYSNPEESEIAIGLLNEAAKKENAVAEIKSVCENYKYALGFISENPVDNYIAALIDDFIGEGELNVTDKEAAIAMYDKAAVISGIKSKAVDNLFDYADKLGLSEGRLSTLYKKDYVTDDFGEYTTEKLTGKTFESFEDFDEALYEQFVFSTVKKADGYANIQAMVSVFKTDIGLNREASKTECLRVMNKEYTSYEDLLEAMLEGEPGSNGGSGGGGGGSSSGGSGGGGGGSSSGSVGAGLQISESYVGAADTEKINKNIFDDIDGVSWATEAIVELAQKGIVSGKGNRLFFPNDNITREECVKIIMMTFFENAEIANVTFADVDDSAWYAPYVKMAYGEDVVKGLGDGLFGTGMAITREDMAVIAYRTAVKAGKLDDSIQESAFKFDDDASIADYAKNAVYALREAEVINGVSLSEFAPKQPLSRAQAAKIIYGIYSIR